MGVPFLVPLVRPVFSRDACGMNSVSADIAARVYGLSRNIDTLLNRNLEHCAVS
jgi:hypothetical protein